MRREIPIECPHPNLLPLGEGTISLFWEYVFSAKGAAVIARLRQRFGIRLSSRTAETVRDLASERWLCKLPCVIHDLRWDPSLALAMTDAWYESHHLRRYRFTFYFF
jgi:hypothetical protein